MERKKHHWTKIELQIYILLLCANADATETEEGLNLIRSKVDSDCFEKMYKEICGDSEEESLEKIQDIVALHHYSHRELSHLRREMKKVFLADKRLTMVERNLERILNNIIY